MKMLGPKAPVASFRWDLVYLLAQLTADTRPEVKALAPAIDQHLTLLKAERDSLEAAEDAAIVATALLRKRDVTRDKILVEAGGVARATDEAVYRTLFPNLSPTNTARLGVNAESAHIDRILGELTALPAGHPLRESYLQDLQEAETATKLADKKNEAAATALALQRSQVGRFKLTLDKVRLETHGKLLSLLKDKEEAESFFRPTTRAPAEDEPTADKGPPPPAGG